MESGNQKTNLNIAIGVAAAFFILAVVFGVLYMRSNSKGNKLEAKNSEVEQLKAELEKDYYQALSDLEEMRGSNEELNNLIEKQQGELTAQKTRIDKLLRDNRNLGSARKQIKDLNAKAQEYLAQINQLTQENELLTAENAELSETKQVLETSLRQTQQAADSLGSVSSQLASEKEELEATKEQLAKKVNIASVVKVNSVDVKGLKIRSNGKTTEKRNADNIDQIQVCFNTTENDVTVPGAELYFIRIVDPNGVTLSIESLGSGTFQNNADGQTYPYTRTAEIAYDNDVQQVCSIWAPGQAFSAGDYTIEVYNKGYLAGSSSFELK